MKTKSFRSFAAAVMTGLFLPQSIGAADLAVMMGPAARPLLFPQPGRLAPYPQGPARPSKPWSQRVTEFAADLSAVAAWLAPAPSAPALPRPSFPRRTIEDLPLAPSPEAAPGFSMAERSLSGSGNPTEDRMLILRSGDIVSVASGASRLVERPVHSPRFEMPWVKGRGIRFRIVYLNSPGMTWGDSKGFHTRLLDRAIDAEVDVPERYRRRYPLYFSRDLVTYEIEVENTGTRTLTGLAVTAGQEAFNMAGGKGPDLPAPKSTRALAPLKPGERAVLVNSFNFSHTSWASLNFEQTHLTIVEGERTLGDEPQAGIADPPNE